ncbi:nuclear transport factor 2 family protein [Colwellia echini]|uniref:Nuclear transport factor 2 family protein n=1 Tax=Colwellia echini TaxID=1982103 RepID=A0ABY3MYH7_9GAMM|nr:nuclear transport factor 2 family protein [Colwellia echini]TYK66206.1 nuclear transport factor 2 family protein [Colwellia echini]
MENNAASKLTPQSPIWLRTFVETYQILSTDNLNLLASIYHTNILFIDPMHKVEGLDELYKYFNSLYSNLSRCQFVIDNIVTQGDEAALYWTMTYQHHKLNKGDVVTVQGSSYIKGHNDKVIYHRDYLDLGAMLYEQLPLFGKLIKWIKKHASK